MTGIKKFVYTKDKIIKIMKALCDEYKLNVYICDNKNYADKKGWDYNCAFCVGNSIFISYFEPNRSLEYKLISFFHEFSHCILSDKIPFAIEGYRCNDTSDMQYEIWITMLGLEFAKSKGIVFSDDAVKWLINQAFTYCKKENLTITNHKISDNEYWITQETI